MEDMRKNLRLFGVNKMTKKEHSLFIASLILLAVAAYVLGLLSTYFF